MESTFLCKENLENIYEYLNTQIVHNYSVNLDSNPKYKKIVKKLAKTIYKNLYETVKDMTVNEFNELVVNKSVPFIKQNIDKEILKVQTSSVNDVQNFNSHDINYGNVDYSNLNNIDLSSSVTLQSDKNKKQKKKTKKPKKKSNKDEYQTYLNDALEFENLIKKSNDKIKDNFKELVSKTQNNFVKDCNIEDTDPFIMDRCAAKDDVIEKGLSKSAFEQIVEQKTIDNINTPQSNNGTPISELRNRNNVDENNQNNQNQDNENYPTSPISTSSVTNQTKNLDGDGLLDYYDGSEMNYKKLFTQILIDQKDFSKNNKVDSYEGEMYLPNLISNYGEEAPIQPLLYQNTNKGSEIINTYSVLIDSGTRTDGAGGENSLSTVTLIGTKRWQTFRIDLEDNLKFDKITDVYLKSFSVINATTTANCQYFMLDIEEFNLKNISNNSSTRSKISIQNTLSAAGVLVKNYTKFENYIATLTPSNYTTLTINLTNQDGEGVDDGNNNDKTFATDDASNRVIFELDFVSRKMKDPIFDYTITKDTAELVQQNNA